MAGVKEKNKLSFFQRLKYELAILFSIAIYDWSRVEKFTKKIDGENYDDAKNRLKKGRNGRLLTAFFSTGLFFLSIFTIFTMPAIASIAIFAAFGLINTMFVSWTMRGSYLHNADLSHERRKTGFQINQIEHEIANLKGKKHNGVVKISSAERKKSKFHKRFAVPKYQYDLKTHDKEVYKKKQNISIINRTTSVIAVLTILAIGASFGLYFAGISIFALDIATRAFSLFNIITLSPIANRRQDVSEQYKDSMVRQKNRLMKRLPEKVQEKLKQRWGMVYDISKELGLKSCDHGVRRLKFILNESIMEAQEGMNVKFSYKQVNELKNKIKEDLLKKTHNDKKFIVEHIKNDENGEPKVVSNIINLELLDAQDDLFDYIRKSSKDVVKDYIESQKRTEGKSNVVQLQPKQKAVLNQLQPTGEKNQFKQSY